MARLLYFACLGLGYIMVEVGLISRFLLALGNATISAAVLITGMLVFSGIGSLAAERILDRARIVLPGILAVVGITLLGYALWLEPVLEWIGTHVYPVRLLLCFGLIAPPAFLMGFPMPTALMSLARLGKTEIFVWAWGVNGSLSVVGAVAVPIIAVTLGLAAVLEMSAAAYLIAIPAFFCGFVRPPREPIAGPRSRRGHGFGTGTYRANELMIFRSLYARMNGGSFGRSPRNIRLDSCIRNGGRAEPASLPAPAQAGSMTSYLQAVVLGLLQGFAELFPISSLGHSVLLPAVLGWSVNRASDEFVAFLVLTHLATSLTFSLDSSGAIGCTLSEEFCGPCESVKSALKTPTRG